MTARSIKRRNAKRMTVYMRLTLWRICGGPSERIPGALALVAPKVEMVDRYIDATGTQTFRQVAKLLQAKEPAFRAFLAARRILYQINGTWTPYAEHIDAGRFVVKTGSADNGHAFSTTRFTPKGVAWVTGLWVDAVGAKG